MTDSTYFWIDSRGNYNAKFDALEKKAQRMSLEALEYSINDCKAAIDAFPENPQCSVYMDEIHVYGAELNRRLVK